MPIINISRLPYTAGKELAEKVAATLEYECVEEQFFEEASKSSGIEREKLEQAFRKAPSLFGMLQATRKRCLAHLQAALLKRLLKDNVVYHGPFGPHMVKGISHVMNVRLASPLQARVALKAERDGSGAREAEKAILREDKQRLALARALFEADDDDPKLFDLVLDTSQVDLQAAVETIVEAVKQGHYQPMTYSLACLERLELACRVKAALVELDPEVEVEVEGDTVKLRTQAARRGEEKRLEELRQKAISEGVQEVEVEVLEDTIRRSGGT